MTKEEIEISERQHAAVIRQMKINNIASSVIATASLFTLITIFVKLSK